MADESKPGARAALDRERVVTVALELLDAVGLDDLTMRRLADRLGVTAASLYWHVRDKDELLTLLADAISAEMPRPDPARPWREELAALAHAARRVALSHRDAARILAATPPLGRRRLGGIEAMFALLRRAGFRPSDVADACYLLNVYVMGFVLDEALSPQASAVSGRAAPSRYMEAGFSAPLGAQTQGRLIVQHGASNLTLRADAALADLYRVAFAGRAPLVEAREGTVRITQRHGRHASCDVTLNGAIPWTVEIDGGVSRLDAQLAALRLVSLHVASGISDTTLRLSHPQGSVPVHIEGGVRRLRIERPPAVALRVHMRRGGSRLTLDGLYLGGVGGHMRWESPHYATAIDCYDLEIGGGADELAVACAAETLGAGRGDGASTLQEQVCRWFGAQSPEDYPHLVALAEHLAWPDQDRRFHLGLQIFLDGLERRLTARTDTFPPDHPPN